MATKKKAAPVAEAAPVEQSPEVAPPVDAEDKAAYEGREPDYVAMVSVRADGTPDQHEPVLIGQ